MVIAVRDNPVGSKLDLSEVVSHQKPPGTFKIINDSVLIDDPFLQGVGNRDHMGEFFLQLVGVGFRDVVRLLLLVCDIVPVGGHGQDHDADGHRDANPKQDISVLSLQIHITTQPMKTEPGIA